MASKNGHLAVVTYLIEVANVDPNQALINKTTSLMHSTSNGYLPVVKYLVEAGKVDPN